MERMTRCNREESIYVNAKSQNPINKGRNEVCQSGNHASNQAAMLQTTKRRGLMTSP